MLNWYYPYSDDLYCNSGLKGKLEELEKSTSLKIRELFIRGKEDLTNYYNEELFPKHIKENIQKQKTACEEHSTPDDETPYSDVFLDKFQEKVGKYSKDEIVNSWLY